MAVSSASVPFCTQGAPQRRKAASNFTFKARTSSSKSRISPGSSPIGSMGRWNRSDSLAKVIGGVIDCTCEVLLDCANLVPNTTANTSAADKATPDIWTIAGARRNNAQKTSRTEEMIPSRIGGDTLPLPPPTPRLLQLPPVESAGVESKAGGPTARGDPREELVTFA